VTTPILPSGIQAPGGSGHVNGTLAGKLAADRTSGKMVYRGGAATDDELQRLHL
jgi:hypothetical protein